MTNTEHYNLARPDPANDVDEEFFRLQQTLDQLDAIIFALKQLVDQKAALQHGHTQADITGLVDALASKMNADRVFNLDDLADVDGAAAAAVNYLLVKGADGQWRPSSAAAAIGAHQHGTGDIVGLSALITSTIVAAFGGDADFAAHVLADISARLAKSGGTMNGAIDLAGNDLKNAGAGVANYIKGLITSKSSAYVISVAAGELKSNGKLLANPAPFTKSLNAAWAPGSGNGGRLEATAIAANATYHLHAYMKNSDGSFDWGYSLSSSAPPALSGYTWVGRFWLVEVDATGANIRGYTQSGNKCGLDAPVREATLGGSFAKTLVAWSSVPNDLSVDLLVLLTASATNVNPSSCVVQVADGNVGPAVGGSTIIAAAYAMSTSTGVSSYTTGKVRTNTAKQLYIAASMGGGGGSAAGDVYGWEDYQLPQRVY